MYNIIFITHVDLLGSCAKYHQPIPGQDILHYNVTICYIVCMCNVHVFIFLLYYVHTKKTLHQKKTVHEISL